MGQIFLVHSAPVKQSIVTLDMEGVLTPEIWIAVAERSGLPELRRTTRDEPDYNKLMQYRLEILDRHGITLSRIQDVIGSLAPLPGAIGFLNALREQTQVIILSDTFEQFARPLLRQLGWPTLFCHRLSIIRSSPRAIPSTTRPCWRRRITVSWSTLRKMSCSSFPNFPPSTTTRRCWN
jgi:bifunctional phosphoserine phosphatase/homoserine phosphotransferase